MASAHPVLRFLDTGRAPPRPTLGAEAVEPGLEYPIGMLEARTQACRRGHRLNSGECGPRQLLGLRAAAGDGTILSMDSRV